MARAASLPDYPNEPVSFAYAFRQCRRRVRTVHGVAGVKISVQAPEKRVAAVDPKPNPTVPRQTCVLFTIPLGSVSLVGPRGVAVLPAEGFGNVSRAAVVSVATDCGRLNKGRLCPDEVALSRACTGFAARRRMQALKDAEKTARQMLSQRPPLVDRAKHSRKLSDRSGIVCASSFNPLSARQAWRVGVDDCQSSASWITAQAARSDTLKDPGVCAWPTIPPQASHDSWLGPSARRLATPFDVGGSEPADPQGDACLGCISDSLIAPQNAPKMLLMCMGNVAPGQRRVSLKQASVLASPATIAHSTSHLRRAGGYARADCREEKKREVYRPNASSIAPTRRAVGMIVVGATFWKRLGAGETMGTFCALNARVGPFAPITAGAGACFTIPSGAQRRENHAGTSIRGKRSAAAVGFFLAVSERAQERVGDFPNQTGGLDLGEGTDLGAGRRSRLCLAPDRRAGPWLVNPQTAAFTRDADCGGRRIQMPLTRAQAPGGPNQTKVQRLQQRSSSSAARDAALSRNSGAYNKERQRAGDVADASLGNAADERIGQTASLAFGTWLDTWSTASHAAAAVEGPPDPSSVVSAAALHSLRARAMDATIMAPPPAGRQTIHPGGKSSAGRAPVAPTRPPKQACQSDVRRRRALTLSPMSGGHYAAACALPAGGPECPCMFPPGWGPPCRRAEEGGPLRPMARRRRGHVFFCGGTRGSDSSRRH
ncbi:hypothetical protein Purlil1_4757 [Purpureocillium lilacinum]|uniref:Uncharacterized protein n=1 Tax=Purpureocillium lilacinum TaxID=33203 RepID=A0ABR0C4C8_PURLI|nr:hypothetical protein Purlil1_4757 [Purpureocillium lilacinum]